MKSLLYPRNVNDEICVSMSKQQLPRGQKTVPDHKSQSLADVVYTVSMADMSETRAKSSNIIFILLNNHSSCFC